MNCTVCKKDIVVEYSLFERDEFEAVLLLCLAMTKENGDPVDIVCNKCLMGMFLFKNDWNILLDAIRWIEENQGFDSKDDTGMFGLRDEASVSDNLAPFVLPSN